MGERKPLKLSEIIHRLEKSYCGTLTAEFMTLVSRDETNFLRKKFENEWPDYNPSTYVKMRIHDHIVWPVLFEEFLQNKFTTAKRFGLEGLESIVTGMKAVVRRSGELGVKTFNIGMAHRGRLNILANVLKKPISQILAEFQGQFTLEDNMTTGDVKYHLGTSVNRVYKDGLKVDIVSFLPYYFLF
jgi:2-oxoglutarate dehydrogenase E1 component